MPVAPNARATAKIDPPQKYLLFNISVSFPPRTCAAIEMPRLSMFEYGDHPWRSAGTPEHCCEDFSTEMSPLRVPIFDITEQYLSLRHTVAGNFGKTAKNTN
jgi:hypothetical protein